MKEISNRSGCLFRRICTPQYISLGLTGIYLLSLIPLFILGWFDCPSADDYTNGVMCYHAWQSGHSLFGLLAAAFRRTVIEWRTWRGCFSSAFFSALSPQVFGIGFYRITPWLVLTVLTISVFSLFRTVFVRLLNADKWLGRGIAALTLLLFVQCTPGAMEMFYWYSGAINYTFMFSISLLFYSSLLTMISPEGKNRNRILQVVVSSFLGFLVSGANQMTALNAAILLASLLCLVTFWKKWGTHRCLLIPSLFFYAGFVLNIAAPGNYIRAEASNGMAPIKAIFLSFYYCLDIVINEWLTWPVILILLLTIPLFWRSGGRTSFRFPHPFVVILFCYCLVSSMMTPCLFATGNISSGRTQGQVFLIFILVLILCTGYLTGWVRFRSESVLYDARETVPVVSRDAPSEFSLQTGLYFAGTLLFLAFGILLSLIPSPRSFTFGSAAADLLNGSAKEYADTLHTRAAIYEKNTGQWVEVEPLKERPELLFHSDITSDPQDWTNQGVVRFYNLEGVVLKVVFSEN